MAEAYAKSLTQEDSEVEITSSGIQADSIRRANHAVWKPKSLVSAEF
jgi:hypothetical protein